MEDGRSRQKWDSCRPEVQRRRSHLKPPRVTGKWQPAVPLWEKEFCKVVGSLNWETLLEMKEAVHLYDNVMKWNDSAGNEAFCSAKKRFWAEKNGFPCDIELPNPDLYIDEINWDTKNDTDLMLEESSNTKTEENKDTVVIFGDALITRREFACVGWGEDPWESGLGRYMPLGSGWDISLSRNKKLNAEAGHGNVPQSGDYERLGTSNLPGNCHERDVWRQRNSRSKGNNKKWDKSKN